MRVRRNTNGSIPKLTSGAGQAYGTGQECCCTGGCTNATGCTGDYVLTTCSGAQIILPNCTASSGTITGSISWADANQLDASELISQGSYNTWTLNYRGYDGTNLSAAALDVDWTATLSAPDTNLMPNEETAGVSSGQVRAGIGFYRRYYLNGDTYTFDATAGCGFAWSMTFTERIQPTGDTTGDYAGSGTTNNKTISSVSRTITRTKLAESEEWTVTTTVQAGTVGVRINRQMTYAYTRHSQLAGEWHYAWDNLSGPSSPGYLHRFTKTLDEDQFYTESPDYFAVQAADTATGCDGDDYVLDNDYAYGLEYLIRANTLLATSPVTVSATSGTASDADTGTQGTSTIALDSSIIESDIGCRDCARVLEVSGTFSHVVCDARDHTPGYDPESFDIETYPDGPSIGDGLEVASVTIAGRLVQQQVLHCGLYYCNWFGQVDIEAPGGDPVTVDCELERIGPTLWQIIVGDIGTIYLKFSGDCPTTTPTICQTLNPITTDYLGGYLHSADASPTVGLTDIDDVSYDTDANYDNWITEHTLTFTEGTYEVGDPSYYCDGTCSSCEDGPELLAVATINGTPHNVTFLWNDLPCQYTGSLGTVNVDSTSDGTKYTANVYDSSIDAVTPIAVFELECTGGGTPVGTYTRTDAGAETVTLSVTA